MADSKGVKSGPWTSLELMVMRANADKGARVVAVMLGRSVYSTYKQAGVHRISLRRAGSRRGVRMGQPHGVRLEDLGEPVAADVRSGRFDLAAAERAIVEEASAPICPDCGKRAATVSSTGLCRVCHIHRLTEKHRDQIEVAAAERDLARARQEKRRARHCATCGRLFYPRPSSTADSCPECSR